MRSAARLLAMSILFVAMTGVASALPGVIRPPAPPKPVAPPRPPMVGQGKGANTPQRPPQNNQRNRNRNRNNNQQQAKTPLEQAIQGLENAQDKLDDDKFSEANNFAKGSENIVAGLIKTAKAGGADQKDKASAFEEAQKQIKDAEKLIVAHKGDDADKKLDEAIATLKGAGGKPAAKKKN